MTDLAKAFDGRVIAMVGNWEPMFHRIRGGYRTDDERQRYAREHSPELVRQLADEGINLVLMHGYKGIGFEREKPDMEDTRRFIGRCHERDILVGTYTQFGTFFNETFPAERPDAMDWCQRDQLGQPGLYSETYFSYHRNRICVSSDAFQAYIREVVRYSVEHVGTDLVYFDNLGQMPCYCDRCRRDFTAHLAAKFPTEADRLERFCLADLDRFAIPAGAYWRPIHCMGSISDPLVQEWILFRCAQMNRTIEGLRDFLGTLERRVPMAVNPPILYGDNAPMAYGIDWLGLMRSTRMFFCEDGNLTQVTADGRLITQHRCYKPARIRGNACLRFHSPWTVTGRVEPELVALTEAAVFNDGVLGAVKCYGEVLRPLPERQMQYIRYFKDHAAYYAGVEQVSEVGVYRNFESLAWSWLAVWPQLTIVEQLLIQSGAQFSYVVDDELDDLDRFRALVVPEMQCLADEHADRIAAFVERGGGLLVTGQSGSRNPAFHRRALNVLAHRLGHEIENMALATFIAAGAGAAGDRDYAREASQRLDRRWSFGSGRVAWMPPAEMSRPLDPPSPDHLHTMIHGNDYWDVPANWPAMLDALDWALGDGRWIPMDTPSKIVPQLARPAQGDGLLVHLVNYDPNERADGMSLSVSRSLIEPSSATWQTPEAPAPSALKMRSTEATVMLDLPPWDHHGTVKLSCESLDSSGVTSCHGDEKLAASASIDDAPRHRLLRPPCQRTIRSVLGPRQ
ncbi:MAG: hypothetical protein CMJ18_27775, partial [Phycisphaeraceae bacterium]|nr:hypothetical protein [Phycisphaeraceae bacterium]